MHRITDVESYNHYFGWYGSKIEDNGPWLDKFHAENPDICLGISEYGCEGIINWHSNTPPVQGHLLRLSGLLGKGPDGAHCRPPSRTARR